MSGLPEKGGFGGFLSPCSHENFLVFPCSLVLRLLILKMVYGPFFPKLFCHCSSVPHSKLATFSFSTKPLAYPQLATSEVVVMHLRGQTKKLS